MSRGRAVLRTVLLALAAAFAIGFGIGTWLRCEAERPNAYLGAAPGAPPAAGPSPIAVDRTDRPRRAG